MDAFILWWADTVGKFLSPQLSVFFVSMIPLIEERGGLILSRMLNLMRGFSSAGRAPALQAGGHEFESRKLH